MIRVLSISGFMPFSGVAIWNARLAAYFAQQQTPVIEWSVLEFVDPNRNGSFSADAELSRLPRIIRDKWRFASLGRTGDNRWAAPLGALRSLGLLRESSTGPSGMPDVFISDTCNIESYMMLAEVQRITGKRPALVNVIHNDAGMHYELAGESFVPGADAVVGVSRHICDVFKQRYPNQRPPIALPLPVPVPESAPIKHLHSGETINLCWSGRVETNQKRVLDLVQLAKELSVRKVDFKLTVLGDGPEMPALRAGFEGLSAEAGSRVVLLGRVPADQVIGILAAQHVFVSVSSFEGTSVSMLEAMAQGLVPVVTNVASGVPDVIRPGINGFTVPIGDMAAMADSIQAIWHNPQSTADLGGNAWRSVADRYGTAAACESWATELTQVARRPREKLRWTHPAKYINRFDRRWIPNQLVRLMRRYKPYG